MSTLKRLIYASILLIIFILLVSGISLMSKKADTVAQSDLNHVNNNNDLVKNELNNDNIESKIEYTDSSDSVEEPVSNISSEPSNTETLGNKSNSTLGEKVNIGTPVSKVPDLDKVVTPKNIESPIEYYYPDFSSPNTGFNNSSSNSSSSSSSSSGSSSSSSSSSSGSSSSSSGSSSSSSGSSSSSSGSSSGGSTSITSINISNITHDDLFVKNSVAVIKFTINSSSRPSSIYVNNKSYAVRRTATANTYEFNYDVGNKAGEQILNISSLAINGKRVSCYASTTIDVRRDLFSIGNFKLDGSKLSWGIVDSDSSYVSGSLNVISKDGATVILANHPINKDTNSIELVGLKNNTEYLVSFSGKYKQDTKLNSIKNISASWSFTYTSNNDDESDEQKPEVKDYSNFVKSITINNSNSLFSKGSNLSLVVTANDSFKDVELSGIVVNNKNYVNISSSNGVHTVEIPVDDVAGERSLVVSSLVLNKSIDLDIADQSLTYKVAKTLPVINYTLNEDSGNYTIELDITDKDSALDLDSLVLEYNNKSVVFVNNKLDVSVPENTTYTFNVKGQYNIGNGVVEKTFFTGKFVGVAKKDYSNFVESIQIVDSNSLFNKNTNLSLAIISSGAMKDVVLNKVVINGIEYTNITSSNGVHTVIVPTGSSVGENTLTVSKLNVDNNIDLDITDQKLTYKVAKTVPSIKSSMSSIDGSHTFTFTIVDTDNALSSMWVEYNNTSTSFTKSNPSVTISVPDNTTYSYVVKASYDIGSGSQELEVQKGSIDGKQVEEAINLDFKGIKSVKLYNASGEVESLSSKPTDLSNYYMEIEPLNAQKIYADVESFTVDSSKNKIYAKADLDGFVSYPNGVQTEGFSYSIDYTGSTDSTTSNKVVIETPATNNKNAVKVSSAQDLFDGIRANKYGNFILTQDIDATGLTLDKGYGYYGTFWGVIDGNGYTISNMPCPLVWGMTGGKVYNLTIDSSNVEGKVGFVADIANGSSIIKNVHIVNSTLNSPNAGRVGGLLGRFDNKSSISDCTLTNCSIVGKSEVGGLVGYLENANITDCALIDCSVTGNNTIGGLVGNAQGTSVVSKTAFIGSVTGTLAGNANGARASGGIGWLGSSASIRNCFIDVELIALDRKGNGGIFGGPLDTTSGSVDNCVVRVVGENKNSIAGTDDALVNVTNVYQLHSNSIIQSGNTLSTISSYDSNYLVDNLELKREYADIAESLATSMGGVISLSVMEGYSASKEIAYNNIVKLSPWLDSATVISAGNNLNGDLSNKKIISIYPMDANDKFIHAIDSNNTGSVSKIRVLYEDKTFETLSLTHDSVVSGLVDTYTINNYSVPYQFNKYIYKDTLELASKLNSLATGYSYADNISAVYGGNVVIQYDYIYENVVSNNLDTFTKNLVASNFASLSSNANLKSNLETDLTSRLPKLLYGYTYLRKNFGFEMGGVDIADLLYFDSYILSPILDLDSLMGVLDSHNKNMSNAYNFFELAVKSATGITLYDQLELFLSLGGVSDYDAWLQEYLDCHIVSRPPEGYTLTIAEYSLWDNLTNPYRTGAHCHVLAVLTIPKEFQRSIGIISTVGTVLYTDIHIYYAYPTEENHVQFQRDLGTMALLYARYFGTSLGYVPNGEANIFKDLTIQYDSITSYKTPEYQDRNFAQNPAPMIRWVSEPAGKTASAPHAGAVSNGNYIYYGYNQALINLGLFTHENAHSMDGTYFLNGYGKRRTSNGEFYTEGFFTEPGSEGIDDISATRAFKFGINDELVAALDYERLNTPDEIEDYYKDLFNASYAYDAMAGNAFLAGGKDVQYKVGKFGYFTEDINHPDRWNPPVGKKDSLIPFTGYWNDDILLESYEDLWNHKISYKGIYGAGNGYERPKFYEINWWTPSNPDGTTDANTFKRTGYEMLGYAGWEVGMIGWASGKYASDEDAIRGVTGYSGMEEYKKARFTEANDKLDEIPYFDSTAMEEVILTLYRTQSNRNVTPAMDLKALIINTVKRVTNDFTDGNMHQMTATNYYEVDTAQELISLINENSMKKGIYIKLTDDIDLSGVSSGNGYFAEHFIGIINGDGHTISGLSKPLLKSSKFAMFNDINFEGDASVLVSNSARYTFVYNCNYDTTSKLYVDSGNSPCNFALVNNKPKPVMIMKSMKSVSDNSVSANSVSANSVSGNSVSSNSISSNTTSKPEDSHNSTTNNESVSNNSVSGNFTGNVGTIDSSPTEGTINKDDSSSNTQVEEDSSRDTSSNKESTGGIPVEDDSNSNTPTEDDSGGSTSTNSDSTEDTLTDDAISSKTSTEDNSSSKSSDESSVDFNKDVMLNDSSSSSSDEEDLEDSSNGSSDDDPTGVSISENSLSNNSLD